jgi:D-alanyl-D-alanine carboxypeptidase (penicillin-binding protein 5/6)
VKHAAALFALSLVLATAPAATRAAAQTDDSPAITALGAVLFDPLADRVLWGRRETVGIPMASTTKIMTALLAIEAGTLDDTVVASRRAARMGGAGLGLTMGRRLSMRSLLAGLILRSGNDAATAVAEHVAGSEEAFVARMNARAAELGLRDTHFLNASGLTEDRRHRASPLDLARLADVAMAHPEFAAWAGARRLAVPGLGTMENRNELIGRYPGANGVKTGHLAHAGYALVASAVRDGLTLHAVVLGSDDSFADAQRLFDWGFARYRQASLADTAAAVSGYRWADAAVAVSAAARVAGAVRRDATVRRLIRLIPDAPLPVAAGTRLGELLLLEDGMVVSSAPLRAATAVGLPPERKEPDAAAGRALQDALRQFVRLRAVAAAA